MIILLTTLGPEGNPELTGANSWLMPIFAIAWFATIVFALVLLIRAKDISVPLKALITLVILAMPFAGSLAWIAYATLTRKREGARAVSRGKKAQVL